MAERCLLYYITDRTTFAPDEPTRRKHLLDKIAEAAEANIDYIQLREKDLSSRELENLSRDASRLLRKQRTENRELRAALLINSRTDVALATEADGVQLRSDDISSSEANQIWTRSSSGTTVARRAPLIGVSCHSPEEAHRAAATGATFAVFAPVFEKKDAPEVKPAGLMRLREACKAKIPVLALGGITLENAESCLEAGASGIAAVRLFQENDIAVVAAKLRHI